MVRRVAYLAAGAAGLLVVLAGCSGYLGEKRAAWRNQEERACTVRHHVQPNAYIERVSRVRGKGACGIDRPLKISALTGGRVALGPVTLNCPMTAALESWVTHAVQPAAMAWFGQPVVEINQMGAYNCRLKNNETRSSLSEHAFGNALDISGFTFADGRKITIKRDWFGDVQARSFLREAFAAACLQFKTVLGPGVRNHTDHFHLDLAHHGRAGTKHYCRPAPDGAVPRRAPYRPGLFAENRSYDPVVTGSVADDGPATYAPVPILRQTMPPAIAAGR